MQITRLARIRNVPAAKGLDRRVGIGDLSARCASYCSKIGNQPYIGKKEKSVDCYIPGHRRLTTSATPPPPSVDTFLTKPVYSARHPTRARPDHRCLAQEEKRRESHFELRRRQGQGRGIIAGIRVHRVEPAQERGDVGRTTAQAKPESLRSSCRAGAGAPRELEGICWCERWRRWSRRYR